MSGWVLVPKMLTARMAAAISDAADNRRFEAWPANCWEDAIAVAPKPPDHIKAAVEPAHSDVLQVPRELANVAALHLERTGYTTETAKKLRALLAGGEV
jgi:hypothetical protein